MSDFKIQLIRESLLTYLQQTKFKDIGYPLEIFHHFIQGRQLLWLLSAHQPLLKKGLLLIKKHLLPSPWEQMLFLRVDLFSEGRQEQLSELPPLKLFSYIPL